MLCIKIFLIFQYEQFVDEERKMSKKTWGGKAETLFGNRMGLNFFTGPTNKVQKLCKAWTEQKLDRTRKERETIVAV